MPNTVAILGASTDRSKYGNKAVRAYVRQGWTVYPVNPRAQEIEGLRCYAGIADVPRPLDRVSMYLPPQVGAQVLDEIAATNPGEVYFNPGSDDEAVVSRARELGIIAIVACSIVEIGLSPAEFGQD